MQTCVGTETPLSKPVQHMPLNLYYSDSRQDHFVTSTKVGTHHQARHDAGVKQHTYNHVHTWFVVQCAECDGLYTFERVVGFVASQPFEGSVELNT